VAVTVKHASKLGTILAAGSKELTVYMFEGDKGAASSCSGACASVWPPVTTSGAPTVAGAANSSDLGTITRSDGATQVTYKGHPLYFFAKDKDSGDAYGQGVKGFGADWYVLSPSGSKVDNS
jgi:predicted lipoprotein with Yx(FWY)xxD motif